MKSKTIFYGLTVLVLLLTAGFVLQKPEKKSKKSKKKTVAVNDTVTTSTGLRYIITRKNPDGVKAEKGDQVEAHYTGTLTDGKKFDSSRDRNQPFKFTLGQGMVIAGWDEGFSILKTGETATLIIPPSLGYGSRDMRTIPANSTLIFDVELLSVKKPVPYEPYSGAGKDTITTASGLRYIVIQPGDPAMKAAPGQFASVYYAGYFMDGKKFDGNFGSFDPFKLPVNGAQVIKGWQEILPLMNKGMQVRVIIPPHLAYGEQGYPGAIPPNSTLIFDMYLDDLTNS